MPYEVRWARKPREGASPPGRLSGRGVVGFTLYNTLKFCDGCVRSLCAQLPADVDILAIDNGSVPDLSEELVERYPFIHVLRVHRNRGVAGGFNAACKWAFGNGTARLYLANDDIIAQPGFWEHCEEALEAYGPGLVASVARDAAPPHAVQSAGVDVDLRRLKVSLRHRRTDYAEVPHRYVPTDAFVGVGFMIDHAVWEHLGVFDERYFLLFEETDYCTRARRAGFSVGVAGQSTLLHFESQTVGGFPSARYLYFYMRNHLWYGRKHMRAEDYRVRGRWGPLKKALLFVLKDPVVRVSPRRVRALFTGLWHGMRRSPGEPCAPAFLQSTARAADKRGDNASKRAWQEA